MSSRLRLRRSPWIVSYWSDGQLVYENYLTNIRMAASPLCTLVLDFFDRWRQPEELKSRLTGFSSPSVDEALSSLTARTFLEEEGRTDPRSSALQAWSEWSPSAPFFHFATKDVAYETRPEFDRAATRRYLRRHPQPPFFKRYPGTPSIPLSREGLPARSEFLRVLLERRTWREFSRRKLSLEHLAQLLYLTWGVTKYLQVEFLGELPLKTSPSGGARHPIEVYVASVRVERLPQGLYHYAADRHELECLRRGPMKRRILRYLGGQWWFADAAAVFLMTADFPRTMWKYKQPRTYRSVLLDAGHLCQTFCLAATWMGLAPFCTMALADSIIEQDIGADGITESAIYAAGVAPRPATWRPFPQPHSSRQASALFPSARVVEGVDARPKRTERRHRRPKSS